MREFLNMATSSTGGASLAGAATGQFILALLTFVCFLAFGVWGAYLRWKDSKALHEALSNGDITRAITLSDRRR